MAGSHEFGRSYISRYGRLSAEGSFWPDGSDQARHHLHTVQPSRGSGKKLQKGAAAICRNLLWVFGRAANPVAARCALGIPGARSSVPEPSGPSGKTGGKSENVPLTDRIAHDLTYSSPITHHPSRFIGDATYTKMSRLPGRLAQR